MLPSVVSYCKENKIFVGYSAVEYGMHNPADTFSSVKRVIGRTISEVQELVLTTPRSGNSFASKTADMAIINKVDNLYNEKPKITQSLCRLKCPAMGSRGTVSPEEVSSEIIKKLLSSAKTYLASATSAPLSSISIENAVITVPAYFSNAQRNATVRYHSFHLMKCVVICIVTD